MRYGVRDQRRPLVFPRGFLWGAGTSSYQVEGGVTEGGRGPSIWDVFTGRPGTAHHGDTGKVACDQFHRYPEDVATMAKIGLPVYRFSVSWARVMPDGKHVSQAGLDYYRRLIDELRTKGIEPMVTLYHWDLPQALEDEGGWRSRALVRCFAAYAKIVHAALGDRVRYWITIDKPFCGAFLAYGSGLHAPGHGDPSAALLAAHHQMLAHGTAVAELRASAPPEHKFSLALSFSPALPENHEPENIDATRRFDGLRNRFFLDPLLGKGYPTDVLADAAQVADLGAAVKDGDLAKIAEPIDWLGVNYYAPTRIKRLADTNAPRECALPGFGGMSVAPPHGRLTAFGWEQHPDSLSDLLRWLNWETGGLPLVIVENGAAFDDTVAADGRVHDIERINYLREHLRAVHSAIERGVDVRGYIVWSFLDHFDWVAGYSKRFGIVHVDFATQRRTLKDSAYFYRDVIVGNAVPAIGASSG
ncbi:GH1 family beta-glucosidase [Amycolatopsis sp. NPDC049868]|uniref:GH1 family beta-glucosidase n=1 Tax=Amycolatopsis sp. NPDC049868 TaxID=3363934 RepID=UPI00378BF231